MQKHSNNGNDIGEVIGVDESILSKYKKHINKKYNNYTKSTTTSFLLKGCAAFFTTGKVSGWLAVHVSREKYFFFQKSKKSCTYITIILINRLWLKNGLQWKVYITIIIGKIIYHMYHLHKVAQNILPNILPFSLKFIMKLYTHVTLT